MPKEKKRRIYSIDTFDDNLEYYGDNKLKKKDVRPTKLVDFEGITKHHNVTIMLF